MMEARRYLVMLVVSAVCTLLFVAREWYTVGDYLIAGMLLLLGALPLLWMLQMAWNLQPDRVAYAPPKTFLHMPAAASVQTESACVYILQDIDVTGYYKIGKSTKPRSRIGHFDTKLPFRVRVVHIIPTTDCSALERRLHRQYASKRKRGEWFALDDADVQAIMQIGVQP
jgi:hypothetical protein